MEESEEEDLLSSPLVKREEDSNEKINFMNTPHRFTAREINPIVTVRKKSSKNVGESSQATNNSMFEFKVESHKPMMFMEEEWHPEIMPI